jgi:molybdopterin molybdotransferase
MTDQRDAVAEALRKALEKADLVVTTGSVSVGQYDVVKEAVQMLGAETLFWKIAMKPGTPMLVAHKDGRPIVSLSGNPAAAMVTFDLIAVPLLKKMSGYSNHLPATITGVLADGFAKASPQRRILRAKWMKRDGESVIDISGPQSSGVLKSLVECNLLVDVPAGSLPLQVGQIVSAFVVGDIPADMVN